MHTQHPLASLLAGQSPLAPEKFGRLFPDLPPLGFNDTEAMAYANAMESVEVDDNPSIPAAYTYFGQFLDHDLTFDPSSDIRARRSPNSLVNFRTPRFDLDCVYGAGPLVNPHLYDSVEIGRMLLGKGRDHRIRPSPATAEDDLPRNSQGTALTGDPRNDQNVLVSQVHLAFLRFHNRIFDLHAGEDWAAAFEHAQKLVRWHYHWVILHDFLPLMVGPKIIAEILPTSLEPARNRFQGRYFRLDATPSIPVEFSGAAYRVGHSMVRNSYVLSDNFQTRLGARIIFHADGEGEPLPDLRGGRFLPWAWSLQWDRFLKFPEGPQPQPSQRIDHKLAVALRNVPRFDPPDLALRNLLRGRSYGLPSGQDVARQIGVPPLEASKPEPLWLYILREAWVTQDGQRLGPVGARIVAEVFLGILAADESSFVNAEPDWRPSSGFFAPHSNNFELKDLIYSAGLPCNRVEWESWVGGKTVARKA